MCLTEFLLLSVSLYDIYEITESVKSAFFAGILFGMEV